MSRTRIVDPGSVSSRWSQPWAAGGWKSPEFAISVLFAVVSGALGFAARLTDDEGRLTFIGAALMQSVPLDALFFQKMHPAASALYAPFAAWGWGAFLGWHVLLSAAAVYLVGATARRLGGSGWLAASVLASSPLYFLGASAGLSNNTGVFFLALAFFLYRGDGGRFSLAAGVVAAAGLWSRYEQAPYFVSLLAYALVVRRDRRFALAFVGVAAAYVLAGAAYHRSLLWVFEYPPAVLQELWPSTFGEMGLESRHVGEMLVKLLLLTPLYLAPLLLPAWRAQSTAVRWLGVTLLVAAGTQFAMPLVGGYFNFDHTARYFLVHLPALAILSSVAVARLPAPGRRRAAMVALGAGVALVVYARFSSPALFGFMAFAVPILLVMRSRRVALMVATTVLALQVVPGTLYARSQTASLPDSQLLALVDVARREPAGMPVFTNAHQVEQLLGYAADERKVRFLPGSDMVLELATLLGERQAPPIFEALRPLVYGEAVWPCEFPLALAQDSLLLLVKDARAGHVYDLESWRQGSTLVEDNSRYELWRTPAGLIVPSASLPEWIPAEDYCLPCPTTCSLR